MNDTNKDAPDLSSMLATWMQSVGSLWGDMADQWTATPAPQESDEKKGQRQATHPAQAAMADALKNWQSMSAAMSTTESVGAMLKGSGAMPEILFKLAQATLEGVLEVQQNTLQRLSRMGESVQAYQFEDIDDNICRLWADIYEKEFRQFFQIPQLGLMRGYQEKANQVADKYNLLQAHLSEFMRMLGLPFNHSLKVMQAKMAEMAEEEGLSGDPKDYYNMWIKILEGHFMTLFQTPEYVGALGGMINALADFSAARNAAMEDMLRLLPVATRSEMDDMAAEMYQLKKRLKKLEKALKTTKFNSESD